MSEIAENFFFYLIATLLFASLFFSSATFFIHLWGMRERGLCLRRGLL